MQKVKTFFLIAFFISLGVMPASATHIVGGVINYKHNAGTNYTVTVRIYRDCFFGQAPFDDPLILGVYDENNNFQFNISLSNPAITLVDPPINNPCLIIPPNICVQEGRYITTLNLPSGNLGYNLVYQRCCRNNTISNVEIPVGATYTAFIPPSNSLPNSNPVFNIFPPLFICVNAPLVFNHSATDADGDSLVYEICRPFDGGDTTNPVPNPPAPPPFPFVIYEPGFTMLNPLGSNIPLTISATGVLTGRPDFVGQFVVGVCVSEYRNGVFLSRTIRDFQFNVTACNIPTANIPSTNIDPNTQIGEFIEVCVNNTDVKFNHQSSGAVTYEWHFGDPTTTLDFSTLETPSYTYPNTTGTYLVTLIATNDVGCFDTARAQVIVHPLPDVVMSNDTFICPNTLVEVSASGGVVYQWFPPNIVDNPSSKSPLVTPPYNGGDSVNLYVFVTDINGCSRQDSVNIGFLPLPIIDAGMDTSVCLQLPSIVDSVQLVATGGVIYNWTPTTGLSDPSVFNPISRPPTNMHYFVTGIDVNGCTAEDSVLVYFLDPQLDLISVDVDEICINDSTQLTVLDQGNITSYLWSPNLDISDITVQEPIFYPPTTRKYYLTIGNYCYAKTDSVEIIVHQLPLANAGNLDSVCLGDSLQLNATGGLIYEWNPSPSISDTSVPNPIVFPIDTTKYYVTVTDINGCISSDSITILVHLPPVPISFVDDPRDHICFGQSVVLISQGGIQYNWKFSETLTVLNNDTTVATPLDTTDYIVAVTNIHACQTKDTVTVNVQLPITPQGDSIYDVCRGLNLIPEIGGGLYYQWTPTDYLNFSNIPNPIITPDSSIMYRVYVSNDCFVDSLDLGIVVRQLPTAAAGPSFSIYRGYSVELDGDGGGDYLWIPAVSLSDPTIQNPIADPLFTTEYYLRVTNEYGCTDFDSLIVTVISKDLFVVPTGFTPNGDGMNDFFWIVQHLNIEDLLDFKVYNRWGEVVFIGDELDDKWDGTYKGKAQEMGNYVFVVKYRNYDGEFIVEKGNVTLLR